MLYPLVMRDRRARLLALIILAAGGLYLLANDRVGLWDRDEPRYAQTSRQMLQSDPPNWVVPMLLDQVRTAKPIFIYWCQAGAMWLLGGPTPFAARLPSAIAMVITLGILAVLLRRYIGPNRALWTILILASCALATAAAKMCITDSVLLLWITIAQLCLYALYRGSRSWTVAIVMWIAIGLAGLTKGPVVLGVQMTTIIVLAIFDHAGQSAGKRSWMQSLCWLRRVRAPLGILILAAVVSPWLIAIERHDPGFLKRTLLHDVWTRTVRPLEGHKGPPGFYLLTIWATFMPWSLLLPTAFTIAWKHRRLPAIRFALAAIIGPWVMFELVQTKLVHYVLPTFPAIAFLTADALVRCIRGQHDDLRRPIAVVVTAVWALAVVAAGAAPWLATLRFRPLSPMLYIAMAAVSGGCLIYAWCVFVQFRKRRFALAMGSMGMGMMAIIAVLYAACLPNTHFLWLPQQVGQSLRAHGAIAKGDVVMIDYKEDSLPFYQGGTIRPREDDFLVTTRPADWPKWIVITRDVWSRTPQAIRSQFEEVESFRGLAYAARGRIVEVMIVRRREAVGP